MARIPQRLFVIAAVLLLLDVFAAQLLLSSERNSVTWDEGHHLYSGYLSWKTADYGINPEVPPLVKMVAAVPLLRMHLNVPPLEGRFFKDEAFFGGHDFLFHNDANNVLLRARVAASVFSFALALLLFAAARQMFSLEAGFIALALFVFDPNFLAHGALVTTDVASACTIFATIYAFYRWRLAPSRTRLLLVGLAAGLALVTKFTGILVFPMLVLLAFFRMGHAGIHFFLSNPDHRPPRRHLPALCHWFSGHSSRCLGCGLGHVWRALCCASQRPGPAPGLRRLRSPSRQSALRPHPDLAGALPLIP